MTIISSVDKNEEMNCCFYFIINWSSCCDYEWTEGLVLAKNQEEAKEFIRKSKEYKRGQISIYTLQEFKDNVLIISKDCGSK